MRPRGDGRVASPPRVTIITMPSLVAAGGVDRPVVVLMIRRDPAM
jgi:hypothetical protein